MPSILNATTTNGLVTSADNSGSLQLQTNSGTTAVTINTAQGVSVLNCLGVGNATPSTSGAGITFPATQSASSDANTLDDYEEGTFTPAFINGTFTYTAGRSGRYVKVGKMVTISGLISWGSKSGSGAVGINLPFSAASETPYRFTGSLGYTNGLGISGLFAVWSGSGFSSQIFIYLVVSGGASSQVDVTNLSAAGEIQYSVTYEVA